MYYNLGFVSGRRHKDCAADCCSVINTRYLLDHMGNIIYIKKVVCEIKNDVNSH